MLNLLNLELKKFRLPSKILVALVCNAAILGIVNLIFFVEYKDFGRNIESYKMLLSLSKTLISITFMVYSSILIWEMIVSEYAKKTITLLFTYPVSRRKLVTAKLIVIFSYSFLAMIISSILVFIVFYGVQQLTNTVVIKVTYNFVAIELLTIISLAIKNSIIALIPIYFGLKFKSAPVTYISGLLLAGMLHSTSNGFNLYSIIIIPIILVIVSMIIVFLTVNSIEDKDVTI